MRSSESANSTMISTWPPKVMRSGNMKKAATAITHGSASGQRKRWRRNKYSAARSRDWWRAALVMACALSALLLSLAAIEPRRLHEQHQNRDGVDEEAAGICQQIFSGSIENPEHQRGEQRAFQTAKPADHDHDQKQHEIEHGKARAQAEELDP